MQNTEALFQQQQNHLVLQDVRDRQPNSHVAVNPNILSYQQFSGSEKNTHFKLLFHSSKINLFPNKLTVTLSFLAEEVQTMKFLKVVLKGKIQT